MCINGYLYHSLQAAILQQTAEYIYTLEQEKTRLLQQNSQQRLEGDDTSPQLKKKRIVAEGGEFDRFVSFSFINKYTKCP